MATRKHDLETLEQRRIRLRITPPDVAPAPGVAITGTTTWSTSLANTRSIARSDAPVIKRARRGDVITASRADSNLGFDVLLEN